MRILLALFLSINLLGCNSNQLANTQQQQQPQQPESKLQLLANGDLRLLELSGTPYERGHAHGRLLKSEIKAVTDSLLKDIESTTKTDARAFITRFLKETDFVSSIQQWTPELLEEIRGISEGSDIDYEVIFMHQLGDEFFFNTEYMMAHKCSSIGINKSGQHPSLAAQNMDIPVYFHGYQAVMKIREQDGREALVLTIPGHIGITGMNNAAVSINCNILMQLEHQAKGLPVSFIVRGVLQQQSHEEALAFIHKVEHASGQNYLLGGAEKVVNLECSATDIQEFRPYEEAAFTYHTNHPFKNKTFSKRYLQLLDEHKVTYEKAMTFCKRIPSFEQRFTAETRDFGIEEIKEVLSSRDHDGRDVLSNDFTYASVVYVLTRDKPELHIAAGKPHEKEYITIPFQ